LHGELYLVNNNLSASFMINNGLQQIRGKVLSVVINLALESVIKEISRTETLNLNIGNILLGYADDIVIIRKS